MNPALEQKMKHYQLHRGAEERSRDTSDTSGNLFLLTSSMHREWHIHRKRMRFLCGERQVHCRDMRVSNNGKGNQRRRQFYEASGWVEEDKEQSARCHAATGHGGWNLNQPEFSLTHVEFYRHTNRLESIERLIPIMQERSHSKKGLQRTSLMSFNGFIKIAHAYALSASKLLCSSFFVPWRSQ